MSMPGNLEITWADGDLKILNSGPGHLEIARGALHDLVIENTGSGRVAIGPDCLVAGSASLVALGGEISVACPIAGDCQVTAFNGGQVDAPHIKNKE